MGRFWQAPASKKQPKNAKKILHRLNFNWFFLKIPFNLNPNSFIFSLVT